MAKNMTLKFESHLEYQDEAVNSICDIFEGEEIFQSNFSITPIKSEESLLFQRATIGIGNSIKMIEEDMLANIQRIQLRNGVPQSTTVYILIKKYPTFQSKSIPLTNLNGTTSFIKNDKYVYKTGDYN